ncbi:MAG: DUF5685 family protein, partial [Oscillospiraceae bacterium]|nr:DUF5685 family protein [Oscillospiraceae bacterium]
AMLLWPDGDAPVVERRRCPARLCRKKACCARSETLEVSAGYSVILAYYKLRDAAADERLVKSLLSRLGSVFLSRAYKKSAAKYPGFDAVVRKCLAELSEWERSEERSLDGAADKFASLLAGAGVNRVTEQLLYQMGRWIYILDACDDVPTDFRENRYNAVARRFDLRGGIIPPEETEQLRVTLEHSQNLLRSAYALLPENAWHGVLRNILYLGMPEIAARVLGGTWQKKHEKWSKV